MKVSKSTWIRVIALAIALLNDILSRAGINPIPYSSTDVYNVISTVATTVIALYTAWKNNSFTREAIEADAYMRYLKEDSLGEE